MAKSESGARLREQTEVGGDAAKLCARQSASRYAPVHLEYVPSHSQQREYNR